MFSRGSYPATMSILLGLVEEGLDKERIDVRYEDRHWYGRHEAEMHRIIIA